MGRRKTPQEKKRNTYRKDVKTVSEHTKTARKDRTKAKATANKVYRSKVKSLLADAADPEGSDNTGVTRVRRKTVKKFAVKPLGDAVASKHTEPPDKPDESE